MSTSKSVAAVTGILIAGVAGLAVAGPPTPADAGRQSGASRQGGARVEPVHLPTGPVGNQSAPQQSAPSPATSAIPTPHYQNSQRNSARGAASNAGTRRNEEGANKLGQNEIQDIVSQQSEAERLKSNVAKKADDVVPKRTDDAIFGPHAPRGPTRNASGASRSSTIGASGIVPPDDPDKDN
jgi:hypothetical protein